MTQALIVDATSFGGSLRKEVKDAIYNGKLKVLISKNSKLVNEFKGQNSESKGRRYKEFLENGFFHFVCGESVERKYGHLASTVTMKSNDQHVIALAIVSGADTMVTEDGNLIADFHNCKRIEAQTRCIKNTRTKCKKRVIKKDSPPAKEVKRIIRLAKSTCDKCECTISGGGC